mmetsp:Transcript_36742/g.103675  ORF Transcript_36742/g.103675 Transcript_36742/m.103675 type:complete len:295 (-) Transcript_36742:463-1347(-)
MIWQKLRCTRGHTPVIAGGFLPSILPSSLPSSQAAAVVKDSLEGPGVGRGSEAAVLGFLVEQQAGHHAHGHELLEEELAGVGDHDLNDGAAPTCAALKLQLLQVCHCREPAHLAHVDAVGVRLREGALLEEGCGAVGEDAVALHLAKAQAAVPGAPLCGLTCEDLGGAAPAAVDLVVHHVLQALVVRRAQEDGHKELLPGVSVVHRLEATHLVAEPVEDLGHLVHAHVSEGAGIALLSQDCRHLAHQALDEMADGHAGGDSMWVDDEIWHDPLHRPRHVLLVIGDADSALLPVT